MSSRLILPVDAIRDRLNDDKEFLLTARFWTCDLRFVAGEDAYFMHIGNGRVESFHLGTQGFDPYTITIGGAVGIWEKMLEQTPKPFYHDWFAASFHHEFEFGGDLEAAYAYYYAIRRIKLIMGECARELRRAA